MNQMKTYNVSIFRLTRKHIIKRNLEMKRMKRLTALVLSLGMLLTLTACGGDKGESGSGNGSGNSQILYHTHNSAPYVTLDPSTEYSNGIMTLQNV